MPLTSCPPSAAGAAASGVLAFLDAVEAHPGIEPHGLIVHRRGRRVVDACWAPHTRERTRLVYSLSKTFTGTALALALGDGLLTLDDLVLDHLPELRHLAAPGFERMRIRHIASMATGHDHETLLDVLMQDREDPVRGFLRLPPECEPGSVFAYNQPPVLTLATILQRLTGRRLVDQLRTRVLDPIGVGDLRWAGIATGVDLGFSGVHTNLDAIARLGQLHLDDGVCDGQRLLPEGWVADASHPQVANPDGPTADWQQGYGFQLWMSQHGYRGDGAFGQYMLVLPEQHAVIAFFSCTPEMQVVMDLVWEHLLPALSEGAAVDPDADAELAARLPALALPTVGERLGVTAPARPVTTVLRRGTDIPTHRSITAVELHGDRAVLVESDDRTELALTNEWTKAPCGHLATSACTLADGRIAIDVVLLASPHRLELLADPGAGTYTAHWPVMPLFGVGHSARLAHMRAPA